MRSEETSPHFLHKEMVYLECLHRQLLSLKYAHRALQNTVVYKACQAPGTPTENYRPRWVGMAEISVHEQEHAYLASSYNDKSQPIFIRRLWAHLQKLRPDHWLLPFKGRHDSQQICFPLFL